MLTNPCIRKGDLQPCSATPLCTATPPCHVCCGLVCCLRGVGRTSHLAVDSPAYPGINGVSTMQLMPLLSCSCDGTWVNNVMMMMCLPSPRMSVPIKCLLSFVGAVCFHVASHLTTCCFPCPTCYSCRQEPRQHSSKTEDCPQGPVCLCGLSASVLRSMFSLATLSAIQLLLPPALLFLCMLPISKAVGKVAGITTWTASRDVTGAMTNLRR